jgi:serine/threonine-protein kinase PpkA
MDIPGYTIQQQIGEGGMASAFLAQQQSLGRLVVLKVLKVSDTTRKEDTERFLNEGRIVASLNHPNVITIYDIGVAKDCMYMSMEYVDGGDLRQRMRGIIAPTEALEILMRIGSGLSAAHKKGIVHRDVKPGNILFRRDRTPLLTDFGIAKQITIDHDLTHTGIFLGSPNYMAPEQAESGSIDGRADIYSLGIIFYEMLMGVKPYQSTSVLEVIMQHKQAPLPQLLPGLEQFQPLLNLMLAKDRRDRFRDVDSMLHYIRHLMKSGALRSSAEVALQPDFDVTGEHDQPADAAQRQANRFLPPTPSRSLHILSGVLLATALTYGILHVVQSRLDRPTSPGNVAGQMQGLDAIPENLPPPDLGPRPLPSSVAKSKGAGEPANTEVVKALQWLAQKSLEEFRLTSPDKDNAYYYFWRLMEVDPDNVYAQQGMLKVAERFAVLAERALADNHFEKAQRYVSIGLQIDPNNGALIALQSLAKPGGKGFLRSLVDLFRAG